MPSTREFLMSSISDEKVTGPKREKIFVSPDWLRQRRQMGLAAYMLIDHLRRGGRTTIVSLGITLTKDDLREI